jgi:hypothetical protein
VLLQGSSSTLTASNAPVVLGATSFTSLTNSGTLTQTGATTFTGAVTATNASNDIRGIQLSATGLAAAADSVWDEVLSGHLTAGSTGAALNSASTAGDPWITALPGSYTAGQAGYILGTNLNATVSSRSSHAATDIVSGGAITTSGGAVSVVTDVTNLHASAATAANQTTILSRIPAALVGGRMDSNTQAMATGVLSADALASDAANEIADAFLDRTDGVETGITPRQMLRAALAACAGVLSGAATTTVEIKTPDGGTTRITATVDADGNRSAITLNL